MVSLTFNLVNFCFLGGSSWGSEGGCSLSLPEEAVFGLVVATVAFQTSFHLACLEFASETHLLVHCKFGRGEIQAPCPSPRQKVLR